MNGFVDGLKAAAEPTRIRLLAICADGEFTVSELTRIVGQSQPRVSRHLSVLLGAGLLSRFRERHWVFYRVPTRGTGADVARALLALLPDDDERLRLDRQRLADVQADRAHAATEFLARHADDWARVRDDSDRAARIDSAVRVALGDERIGAMLDIGTGTGRMLRLLGPRANRAIGIDISPGMLNVARSSVQAAGLSHVSIRRGDMYQLAYPDGAFDLVTIDQVLYQAEDPLQVVREAARILKPGGRLLIVDFAPVDTGRDSTHSEQVTRIGISDGEVAMWLRRSGLAFDAVDRIDAEVAPAIVALAHAPTRSPARFTDPPVGAGTRRTETAGR